MEVRPPGRVIEAREEQRENAYLPMEVRLSGRVIAAREEQPEKAPS
eukprot:CAMPEP_0119359536 /NCGR_PEP_ID=MMETSP1334-20130426/7407_1 /TAXON_ID=127549 /ORGANISM="Calcidiscus leptoporus, Strain RCC1130" /LENGTH=45 /DNA_ID= /DNA_START= /DNA_END= /DNA_ORIENTATION=